MSDKRKLRRRIRERMLKTGESYVTARLHVLKATDSLDNSVRKPAATTGDASFKWLHLKIANSVTLQSSTDDRAARAAAEEKRLWMRLEKEVRRLVPPRYVRETIEKLRMRVEEGESLERRVLTLESIPLSWREMEELNRQVRQVQQFRNGQQAVPQAAEEGLGASLLIFG